MDEQKITTLHPEEGNQGVNISRSKDEMIRQAILKARGLIERVSGPENQKLTLKR